MDERKKIRIYVCDDLDDIGDLSSPQKLIAWAQSLIDETPPEYRDKLELAADHGDYDESYTFHIYYERPETDEEYQGRVIKHNEMLNQIKRNERAQYERLKAKFEK